MEGLNGSLDPRNSKEMQESNSWYLDPLVAQQKRDVFLGMIRRSVHAAPTGAVLKTDLFEEANGEDRILDRLSPSARLQLGIDMEFSTVETAKRNGGPFQALCCDARALPFRSGSFELVVSTSTLDHFEVSADLRVALRELVRVLQPGGTLVVMLDNPRNPMYYLLRWITRRGWTPFSLGHTIPLEALADELERAGLEIDRKEYLIHNPRLISTAIYVSLRRTLGRYADGPIRLVLSLFAISGRLPIGKWTGCFSAVSARKLDKAQ